MKGHYLLKWLFLTVLSVSVLHFRESGAGAGYKIEQISSGQSIGRKAPLDFNYFKRSAGVRPAAFAYFKNEQYAMLALLSDSLSVAITRYSELRPVRELSTLHIQNQHFRSRTLSSDEHAISLS